MLNDDGGDGDGGGDKLLTYDEVHCSGGSSP